MHAVDVDDNSRHAATAAAMHAVDVDDNSRHAATATAMHAMDVDGDNSRERITAMPALDKLDMSVLDNLPAAMRLELLQAYGLCSRYTPRKGNSVKGGGKAGGAGSSGRKRKTPAALPTTVKRQTVRSLAMDSSRNGTEHLDLSKQSGRGAVRALALVRPRATSQVGQTKPLEQGVGGGTVQTAHVESGLSSRGARQAVHGLTLTQVDPTTFQELPEGVKQVLRDTLPCSRDSFIAREDAIEVWPARQQTFLHGPRKVSCLP
jgi:hypothetical protein